MYLHCANNLLQANKIGANDLIQDTLILNDELNGKSEVLCNACTEWISNSMYEQKYPLEDEGKNGLFETVHIDVFEKSLLKLSSAIYI